MSAGVESDAKLSPATIFSLSFRFWHLPGTNKALKDFTKVTPNFKRFILGLKFYLILQQFRSQMDREQKTDLI